MQSTRRGLLMRVGLAALGWAARPRTALGAISVAHKPSRDALLVSIFLRGGADGLSVVVPHGDDDYYRSRPTLALAGPRDRRVGDKDSVRDLDGFFGLHPALAALQPLYDRKQMAIVHACGSGDQTRSHFEAMATVERGIHESAGPASGWIARHLECAPGENASPLRAVAIGDMVPDVLRGTCAAAAVRSVAEVRLNVPFAHRAPALTQTLSRLYGAPHTDNLLGPAGTETLSVLETLHALDPNTYRPDGGAVYGGDPLGAGLRQVALLAKSGVGLEVACLDQEGYDTHVAQGTSQGALATLLRALGDNVAAFATDLGPERWARTTVVVLSEFGRRIGENSGAGTDHGRGGVLLALGGRGIAGGRVHGAWPGLAPEHREGPGDLKVTTDFRDVLGEIVARRLGNPRVAEVFPSLRHRPLGIADA